jgi:hypothetical protein
MGADFKTAPISTEQLPRKKRNRVCVACPSLNIKPRKQLQHAMMEYLVGF